MSQTVKTIDLLGILIGEFDMEIQQKDGVTVIIVGERLDSFVAPKFRETVKKMSEESKAKLVVDMAKTIFIDSSGCGALVASLRTLLRNQGDIKIASPISTGEEPL